MKKIVQFINSIYFIILVNLIAILFWYLKEPFIAYLIYLVFCIVIMLTKANRAAIASIILCAIITYRVDDDASVSLHSSYAKMLIPLGAVLIILFIVDIARKKSRFKLSSMFYAFLGLVIVNIFSFINIRSKEISYYAILGILQLLGFLIAYVYILNTHDNNGKKYISSVALITATAITIELVINYITLVGNVEKSSNDLYWAVSNSIAMFYLILMPIGLYNYFKDQKNFYILLLSGFNFFMMLYMLSRGAYLSLAIMLIPILIIFYKMAKDKKRLLIDAVTTLIICIVVAYFYGTKFGLIDMIIEYFNRVDFLDQNGRGNLLLVGWELFKENPIFGAGAYSGAYYLKEHSVGTYHNYIVQTIATTGVVGLIGLLYFIYTAIKTAFKKDCYNILFLISFIYILIHGMLDNTIYNPIIMIFLAITMPLLETYHENLEDFEIN